MPKAETPCPFCGGDGYDYRFDSIFVAVRCCTCNSQGPAVKIPVDKMAENQKSWAQVYGRAAKRAHKRWNNRYGVKRERSKEDSNSDSASSSVLGAVPRHEVSSDGGLSPDNNTQFRQGRTPRVIRSVPSRRRPNPRDYERD